MKATVKEINGAPTVENINEAKMDKVFSMTGFNYGLFENDNGNGTFTVTFDSRSDAEKFVKLYNELN